MDINDTILKAVEVLIKSAIQNASFDKTILATIEKQSNENEYKYNYQGAMGTATSLNGMSYKKGDNVYILIPSTANGQDKIILGKV